jgi:uncharacterized OsmC-like protein
LCDERITDPDERDCMTERTVTHLNDVNVEAIGTLVEKIRREPDAAKTCCKSEVRWTGALRSESRSRDLAPVPSDEPTAIGGSDSAPNPVEQVLAALGNCLAVGYAANASVAGIRIRSLLIELEGSIDLHAFLGLGGENAGYESIRATVKLDSDATPEQLQELHRRVIDTSPVGHTLRRAVPLQIELG